MKDYTAIEKECRATFWAVLVLCACLEDSHFQKSTDINAFKWLLDPNKVKVGFHSGFYSQTNSISISLTILMSKSLPQIQFFALKSQQLMILKWRILFVSLSNPKKANDYDLKLLLSIFWKDKICIVMKLD